MFSEILSNISSDMTILQIRELINEKYNQPFNDEIISIAKKIKAGEDEWAILNEVKEHVQNEKLFNIINRQINNILKPYHDVEFLRNMELSEFKTLINSAFENIVIKVESYNKLVEILKIESEEIKILNRLMNTVNEFIIVKRFTKNNFQNTIKEFFDLSIDKIDIMWNLFDENSEELINIALLNSIALSKSIKSDLRTLVDIFKEIFDEESDIDA